MQTSFQTTRNGVESTLQTRRQTATQAAAEWGTPQSLPFLAALLLALFWLVLSPITLADTIADTRAPAGTQVVINTSEGDITLELFDEQSPITVKNFLEYVDEGHYDGTIFHRVIPNFMIQGGGFDERMREKPTRDGIKNESKNRVYNERGTIAMARKPDPHSATAQFFINVRMNAQLNYRLGQPGYAVFGKVIEGMEIVDAIVITPTRTLGRYADVPEESIVIHSLRRLREQADAAEQHLPEKQSAAKAAEAVKPEP